MVVPSPLPSLKTFRVTYRNSDGLRCTTFIEATSDVKIEDVSSKIPKWEKIKFVPPTKEDLEWAREICGALDKAPHKSGCTGIVPPRAG